MRWTMENQTRADREGKITRQKQIWDQEEGLIEMNYLLGRTEHNQLCEYNILNS
jgi:hypothetical protein